MLDRTYTNKQKLGWAWYILRQLTLLPFLGLMEDQKVAVMPALLSKYMR